MKKKKQPFPAALRWESLLACAKRPRRFAPKAVRRFAPRLWSAVSIPFKRYIIKQSALKGALLDWSG